MSNPIIAGFELLEKLGEGGAGAVYKARQLSLGRLVAIKILTSHLAEDPEQIARFKKEAQTSAQLKHPGIVQVYEAGQEGSVAFIAMEFVNGYSVGDWIERRGSLEARDVVAVGLSVARALDYAWQKSRLIHLDIKPDNLMVDEDGTIKVTDLGLALMLEREPAPGQQEELQCTPNYAPPELIRGTPPPDCRADIYSLGASMYHMVTGRLPFDGQEDSAVLESHLHSLLEDPSKINPAVPPGVSLLLRKMMARDPEMRYADWAAVAADMERIESGNLPFAPIPEHVDSTIQYEPIPTTLPESHRAGKSRRVVVRHTDLKQHLHPSTGRIASRKPSLAIPILLMLTLGAAAFGAWKFVEHQRAMAEENQRKEEKTQELAQAFQAAKKFATERPEDLGGISKRFQDVAEKARGMGNTGFAETCMQEIESAKTTYRIRADRAFWDLREQATVHQAKREYGKAIAIFRDYKGQWADATRDRREKEIAEIRKLSGGVATTPTPPVKPPRPAPSAESSISGILQSFSLLGLPPEAAPCVEQFERVAKAGNLVGAKQKLVDDLDVLVREFTRQGRIDEAIKLRDAKLMIAGQL